MKSISIYILFFCVNSTIQASYYTDDQKIDQLKVMFSKERFEKGCLDLDANILVSGIVDPEKKNQATQLLHTQQIKHLRAQVSKQKEQLAKLENKCCVIQ